MPPPNPRSLPLTLILAATPSLGIGQAGQLPWPSLKSEMGYFARVTKRVPPNPASATASASTSTSTTTTTTRKRMNAVVMGRKTWDSIPERFRPLKGRVNVVVTRNPEALDWRAGAGKKEGGEGEEGPVVVSSVSAALERLQTSRGSGSVDLQVERVFVIGGASIYKAALELPQCERVLLTDIKREFECDTFFPLELGGEEGGQLGWKRRSKAELESWVGEDVDDALEEKGVRFEFVMFEREVGG
ncbi:hypothetical protein K491DRAFT_604319 [Lophiostoma macrostomum CBS 122681]|uniref:Dihydrofolate reductase n=1 Tax=Lophiostoma macrostomum CBS 122681 TaxID=1314788 RepID=A0A6A6SYR5_9PLEO|nr:hypothetical protein K491DRAFT_604319 [Lophiostoma macrostomum CBS 122681]